MAVTKTLYKQNPRETCNRKGRSEVKHPKCPQLELWTLRVVDTRIVDARRPQRAVSPTALSATPATPAATPGRFHLPSHM